jgi:hypothetical protein
MTTTFEQMQQVLIDSGLFTIQQIENLFCDAQIGTQIRISNEDDEDEEENLD